MGSGGSVVMRLLDRFGPPPPAPTYASVTMSVTEGSGFLGSVWISFEGTRMMAAMPAEGAAALRFIFPHQAQAQGYWTGINILNPNESRSRVIVQAFASDGALLGSKQVNLGPKETATKLIYEWIPETFGVIGGRIEVRSDIPVNATEIFGSDTGSFMVSVPGQSSVN